MSNIITKEIVDELKSFNEEVKDKRHRTFDATSDYYNGTAVDFLKRIILYDFNCWEGNKKEFKDFIEILEINIGKELDYNLFENFISI